MNFKSYVNFMTESKNPDELIPGDVKSIIGHILGVLNIQNAPSEMQRKKVSFHKFNSGSSAILVKLPARDPRRKQLKDWYKERKIKGLSIQFRE